MHFKIASEIWYILACTLYKQLRFLNIILPYFEIKWAWINIFSVQYSATFFITLIFLNIQDKKNCFNSLIVYLRRIFFFLSNSVIWQSKNNCYSIRLQTFIVTIPFNSLNLFNVIFIQTDINSKCISTYKDH